MRKRDAQQKGAHYGSFGAVVGNRQTSPKRKTSYLAIENDYIVLSAIEMQKRYKVSIANI